MNKNSKISEKWWVLRGKTEPYLVVFMKVFCHRRGAPLSLSELY